MVIVSRVQVFREQLNSSCTSFTVSCDIKASVLQKKKSFSHSPLMFMLLSLNHSMAVKVL